LIRKFIEESKAQEFTYTPYWLTSNGHMQAIMSVITEICLKFYFPIRYEREEYRLSDGGTIALDWAIDEEGGIPSVTEKSKRPILCCFSGVSGGNDNMYLYSMIRAANKRGYKCVVINFRGCAGMKLTSPKIYWVPTWPIDIKEPIEYVHSKYCCSPID
jgi:predicted alpha/beta-fold hydrolase